MYRILLIAIALIVYGSLWPWQYNPAHATGSPLSILFHSWSAKIHSPDVDDIVVNLLLYLPVGMFGYLALDRHHHRRLRIIGPILLGFILSGSIEMLQVYDKTRDCSAIDLLCNTVGAVLGVGLGYVFRQSHLASLRRPAIIGRLHTSGPLVLIYIWVG
ncbi:MAG: VanZ family protein, partial [Acidobacteriota bacterium]|nr:VanZ family protein [Acidobacteriota bacterium]